MTKILPTLWLRSLQPFRKSSGKTVDLAYIKKPFAISPPIFNPIGSGFLSQGCFLYWDDAAVQTPASVLDFKWQQRRKDNDDLLPTIFARYGTPVGFFFIFLRAKPELAGILLAKYSFKMSWDGVIWTIIKDEFADTF